MIGIYLLKQKDKVVYVGQSINIENRIKQHIDKKFAKKEFKKISKTKEL